MHVIFLEPAFPANQREFVRGLHYAGATISAIGTAPLGALDGELRSWLHSYERVQNSADVGQLTGAVKRIQTRGPWVHKLECTVEALMIPAAQVRANTMIPGLSIAQTELVRDKVKMKAHMLANGIRCAQSAQVGSLEDAAAFVKQYGYPVIIKPIASAGAAGTWRADDGPSLADALRESGASPQTPVAMEEFIEGHEGFWDTLTVGGNVVFEQISHYFPNVLTAMRHREISPYLLVTNRVDSDSYNELKLMGRQVIRALGLETSPTHMEWFYGPKGLFFSEIGARPPGVSVWDLYCAANEMDLYYHWAHAVVHGMADPRPSRRYTAGMIALRPNRDGRIAGYSGVDAVQQRYGDHILRTHLPPRGHATQAIEAGYMANAWIWVRHPDYDACQAMCEDIGRTLRVWAE